MATSSKVGFISDSEMEQIAPAPKGFISDDQMIKFESSSAPKDRKASAALEGFGEGATLGYLNNLQAATEKPVFKISGKIKNSYSPKTLCQSSSLFISSILLFFSSVILVYYKLK